MTGFLSETPLGGLLSTLGKVNGLHLLQYDMMYGPIVPSSTEYAPRTTAKVEKVKAPIIVRSRSIGDEEDWLDEWESSPKNPQKWPRWKKLLVMITITFYTFVVYSSSATFVVSIPQAMVNFQTPGQTTTLGLSLYILGQAIGPLIWGPLSEVSWIGRNPVYVTTGVLFFAASIPAAILKSFPGFVLLRFGQGLFGSSVIANGGATMQDIFNEYELPLARAIWIFASIAGLALGPVMSGYLVMHHSWRWSIWITVILAVPALIMLFILPETYSAKIRHNLSTSSDSQYYSSPRAQPGLLRIASENKSSILLNLKHSLVKPVQITLRDPAVLLVNVYVSLCYATLYSFLSSFPLAFSTIRQFDTSQLGLSFICIFAGVVLATSAYCAHVCFFLNPSSRAAAASGQKTNRQEERLRPALVAVWLPPLGLLLFGWSAQSSSIHWLVPMLGVVLYTVGVFLIFQCLSTYISQSYPDDAASLFATNDFSRNLLAAGTVHFTPPLYTTLGLGGGSSLLAGLSVLGVLGLWILYVNGEDLRRRSGFAAVASSGGDEK